MARKKGGRKKRVQFRQNRQARRRSDEWTRRYHADAESLDDSRRRESVRPKGDLSRKRTVIVNEEDAPAVDESLWLHGIITTVHGLICYVEDDQGRRWECTVRRVLRTLLIESRSPVTVGDRVWFSDQSAYHDGQPVGVIERVEPRRSVLARRDRRGRQHTIVANADQLLIVTSVAEPRLKPHLIDRYLVAARKGSLEPIVCINKVDLADEAAGIDGDDMLIYTQRGDAPDELAYEDFDEPEQTPITVGYVIRELSELGFRCIRTSAQTGCGIPELREALKGHVTVLSGQSGVGKSSVLNAVQPGLHLRIGEVSAESQKGRHTTTHAQLIKLEVGGHVVDTPGIRAFDLWDVEPPELEALFPEFEPFLPHCRFSDCLHRDEEGCAVIDAVEAGKISLRRYLSYYKMYEETLDQLGYG